MTAEIESLGAEFRHNGTPRDIFDLLSEVGINMIRLRLWVDPRDPNGVSYMGGGNDLPTTIRLAQRAKRKGMQVMLVLFYSDFWADPQKQRKPKSWEGVTGKDLESVVSEYTATVLQNFESEGAAPDMVQIGNEIARSGMLWPDGQTPPWSWDESRFKPDTTGAWDRVCGLLKAGVSAARSASDAKVILHLDSAGKKDFYRSWLDIIGEHQVEFDTIGLSYYPYWSGTLDDLGANMNDMARRYNKELVVVETSYAWTLALPDGHSPYFIQKHADIAGYPVSVAGQTQYIQDLWDKISAVPEEMGLGLVYWEAAWLPVDGTSWASDQGMEYGNCFGEPGNSWANQALFDFEGNSLESLRCLGRLTR